MDPVQAAKHIPYRFEGDHYYVGDRDVSDAIRTPKISTLSSKYSAIPEVREALIHFQKKFAKKANSVFEGRDLGTVVFPNAEVKVFLIASIEERAKRRFRELKGENFETVLKELIER